MIVLYIYFIISNLLILRFALKVPAVLNNLRPFDLIARYIISLIIIPVISLMVFTSTVISYMHVNRCNKISNEGIEIQKEALKKAEDGCKYSETDPTIIKYKKFASKYMQCIGSANRWARFAKKFSVWYIKFASAILI